MDNFTCNHCAKGYKTAKGLEKHNILQHMQPELPFVVEPMKLRVAELCAGTGAFSLAFKIVDVHKYDVVFANDFEPTSKQIFDANNTVKLLCKDMNTIEPVDIPTMDILTSGFPCQPFSIAGMQNGFDDTRSNVFWKIIEILKHHMPRIAILENVKNLQAHDNGNTFKTVKTSLENIGYKLKYKVMNTCVYTDIPQNRERIYIVCFRDDADYNSFEFPEPLGNHTCVNIQSLLQENIPDKYYYTENSGIWEKLEDDVTKMIDTDTVYQYRRFYVRENKNNVCPTLTANMGLGGHNVPIIKDSVGIRKFTPKECFNLQGFPDSYVLPNISDAKLYKLAGNAVSVPLVVSILKRLQL